MIQSKPDELNEITRPRYCAYPPSPSFSTTTLNSWLVEMIPPKMASSTVSFIFIIITTTVLSTSLSSQLSDLFPSNNPPPFLGKHSHPIKQPNHHQQYRYETRYFSQPLDHFSFLDLPRFRQRYLINTEHWVGPSRSGPIFLYCGNEGDIEWFAVNTGFVWDIAPRFGAMILFPEVNLRLNLLLVPVDYHNCGFSPYFDL